MHGIRPEARLIPEKHLSTIRLRLPRDGGKRLPPPSFNSFWIALVGPLQRFLWGQAQLREQLSHRGLAWLNAELLFDQTGHDGTRPELEVEAILAGVLAIDRPNTCCSWRGDSVRGLPAALVDRGACRPMPGRDATPGHL